MVAARSFRHWCALALTIAGLDHAWAEVITRDLDFAAVNQNPFIAGPAFFNVYDQAIPLPTQRTDFPALIIPRSPATYPRLEFGGSVTGEMNLDFWAGINSGRLNINYPVRATFDLPDSRTVGRTFSLGSSATVFPDGYSHLDLVGLGSLSGWAPSSSSYHGLAKSSAGAPSVGNRTITLVSASTDGNVRILPDVPGAATTFSLPQTVRLGTFASFTVDKPDLGQQGTLVGSALQASKARPFATLTLDVLLSNAVLNPLLLPPLTGNIGPVRYSLLDANSSLSGGLYQNLDFNVTRTNVTLAADHYFRARQNCIDRRAVKTLEFNENSRG